MSSNEDLKVGFQDSSATIADISESSTVAIVNVGQLQLRKIEAPTEGCLSIHLAMICYINSSKFNKLEKATRNSVTLTILKFFGFLSSFKADKEVSFDCLNVFIQYQGNNSKAKGSVIYNELNKLKNCLHWCFNENSPLSDDTKLLCRQYYMHAHKIQPPEKTPTAPLSKLFAECPYNDTQLLDSLIKLSIWIINYEAHFRSEALQIHGIRQLTEDVRSRSIYKCPISFASFDDQNATKNEARALYGTIIMEARDSGNLVLKERLVADIRHPFKENVLTEEQLNWVLDRSLMKATNCKHAKCRKAYQITQGGKKKSYALGAFKCFSIRSLLVPTDIECFAMQCLLASEKMNGSSIENLSLDDVVKTSQGIQFQFQKKRRPTKNQVNITALHRLGSTIGKTYTQYIDAKKAANEYFDSADKIKLLSYQAQSTKNASLGSISFGAASNKYIDILLTEKSQLRGELLKAFEASPEDLEPIFWLLAKVIEQNKKVAVQQAEYDRKYKKNNTVKRSDLVSKKSIGLTTEVIRQSAIISEDARLLSSPNLFNDTNVTAQSSNHSPNVHYEVYIDRSTAKEKIESDRLFVSRIGALMVQDATLMGELIEKTSVLDYNQALEVLGLPRADKSTSERISKRIDELGINIDLMDSFQTNGKKVFLANKTSIALIIKYLEHIRDNFDEVLNDDSPQLTKATLAVRDYFYFSAILQKFPTEVRKEGEKYADSLSFSYAKLSDIAGVVTNE
ncbi:hypothetical protein [Marinomonas flavescens]|uniref:hypothetical protein n=1 Tax=Marinomonas flavescens TaxID=2529379 RepID=UPI00105595CF|nr:hypothetical protein [Marinomonas flavescens]